MVIKTFDVKNKTLCNNITIIFTSKKHQKNID